MDRRRFLKSVGAGAAVGLASQTAAAGEDREHSMEKRDLRAAPCGLYCGVCGDYANGVCHGCRCDCGKCIGQGHADICEIVQCVNSRKLESCADCKELPCTKLIQFTFHPVWRTHLPCIENLRRRKRIGTDAWIEEREAYWKDEKNLRAWKALGEECERRATELRKANEQQGRYHRQASVVR